MVGVLDPLGRGHLWQSYLGPGRAYNDSVQTTTSSAYGLPCLHYLPTRIEIQKQKIMNSNFFFFFLLPLAHS